MTLNLLCQEKITRVSPILPITQHQWQGCRYPLFIFTWKTWYERSSQWSFILELNQLPKELAWQRHHTMEAFSTLLTFCEGFHLSALVHYPHRLTKSQKYGVLMFTFVSLNSLLNKELSLICDAIHVQLMSYHCNEQMFYEQLPKHDFAARAVNIDSTTNFLNFKRFSLNDVIPHPGGLPTLLLEKEQV